MIDKAPSSYEEGALLFSIKKALTTKNDFFSVVDSITLYNKMDSFHFGLLKK